ncbi:MAG: cytidine deaminase [Gemmatimonadota bacterium]|jgi:cytidine deaminase
METLPYDALDSDDQALLDAARAAADTAYAPYSGVRVGAALRTASGIVTGSNVENGAYGSTICAERMAVGRANARGERSFAACAITATGDALRPGQVISPCGACRQVLHEMAYVSGIDTRVLMAAPGSDAVTVATLAELLPLPFDPLPR